MHLKPSHFIVFSILFFSSCIPPRRAYYVSPFNGNSNVYHTIPLHNNKIKTATYVSGLIMNGGANGGHIDKSFIAQANISRSHNFGNFQAFYSGSISVGNYAVRIDTLRRDYTRTNYEIVDMQAGNKSLTGLGIDAGINYVLPFNGGEWRIGGEASASNDYGKYYNFRKNLPDSAADIIIPSKHYSTIGGYSEILAITRKTVIGFKISVGTVLGSDYNSSKYQFLSRPYLRYNYMNFNMSTTINQYTGYLQANFATKASAIVLGVNYKLTQ